jgi:hypothetical protein
MKKRGALLLMSLLIVITSTSQTISDSTCYSLTPLQLKATNLIFNEHKYLLKNDSLQKIQLNNYKLLVNNLDSTISYKNIQLDKEFDLNKKLTRQVNRLSKSNYLFGGISILAILWILVK